MAGKSKLLIKIAVVLVILVVVGVVVALGLGYYFMNDIVKQGVERVGPYYAGVPITVEEVSLSPFSGAGEIKGLTIGNPQGFNTPQAVKLGTVRVAIDLKSLKGDTIHIKEVYVEAPEIALEFGPGGTNIQQIQRNIEAKLPASKEEKESAKKLVIDNLQILDGKAGLSASFLQGKSATIALTDITMTDIGKDKKATVAEVLNEVFKKLVGALGSGLDGAKGMIGGGSELLQSAGQSGADAVKSGAGAITEGIKGIFGGKK